MYLNREAKASTADARATLVITGHYRLAEKPVRTLEALRIFVLKDAEAILDALLASRRAPAFVGERRAVEAMARAMRAQGFEVTVAAVEEGVADG